MSIKALQDYTIYAKYAKYNNELKRRETWDEQVDRVFSMHERKFQPYMENETFKQAFVKAKELVKKKRVLGSQRALQFGGPSIEAHNAKLYNCCVTYIDRPRAFQEVMYLLLCGCGVGFSVQNCHIKSLPSVRRRSSETATFVIGDSIEGWADAIGVVLNSYFENGIYPEYSGKTVEFDYSLIRPEGAHISGGFKAPGPKGLQQAINRIENVIERQLGDNTEAIRLRPIDVYDILMHASDAVLSGGVRRSATICIFDHFDDEMLKAKTGNWFVENPQRGRSNNSVLLVRNKISKSRFKEIMTSVKEFGEPGFVFAEDEGVLYNPCVEIGLYPSLEVDGNWYSGVQFCNLCEINGKQCKTEELFYEACEAVAVIGTMQAAYTDFPYLGEITEAITRKEALLGCSITGMMDSPDILFDPEIQRRGAEIIKETNRKIAEIIGINQSARTTCVKPAGSTSCILGTASGIHPHHAKRYFRRVQANKLEFPLQEFEKHNPLAVETSVWSNNNTDKVITFICEVPSGSIIKNQISAITLLERVKLTQQNWVTYGTNTELCSRPHLRHNVSNTIIALPEEWDELTEYIYENREWFAGISLLPASGDKDYPQAPFCSVPSLAEYTKKYGEGGLFASGLIVDGLKAFKGNLWEACDSALGMGKPIEVIEEPKQPTEPKLHNVQTNLTPYTEAHTKYLNELLDYIVTYNKYKESADKLDWIRRAKQFSERYFEGDIRLMTYCLKDCHNIKLWNDLTRTYKDIDWSTVVEEEEYTVDVNTLGAQACAGGACEIV